ncbi:MULTISPECIES: ABC transporter substrate-binding protein [unclassified Pseudarthrobacter]|uniref:ABC transporter substrate-binding protein n=1 Tax=unclassified Pseudarthrobacter TaxID=2647000 RepID=UPI00363F6356
MHPARPAARRRPVFAASLAAVLALSACSGVTGNARVDTVEASGDGVLRVGLILDNAGDSSFLNTSQLAAAQLAVREINAAGGHKGRPVELLPVQAGGDTAAQAHALVSDKADVVIGPTDSSHATEAIDVLSRARTPLISPANTAAGLSSVESGGYYFRTTAADVAQGPVLAMLAKDGGAKTIAILHQEGTYGKEVAAAVADAASGAGLQVLDNAGFAAGEAGDAARKAGAAKPDAVVVVAREGSQGALAELNNAGVSGASLLLSDGAFARYGSKLGTKALDGTRAVVSGQLPSAAFQARLLGVDEGLKDVSYAAETFDAVTLAALAAARAQDDAGPSIAANLVAVSGGTAAESQATAATPCTTYKDCLPALASGGGINYDGESGPISFDTNGDITSATFTVFTYGSDNIPTATGHETAGRTGG